MSGFRQLLEACERLDASCERALVGAVKAHATWTSAARQPRLTRALADLRLLNAKAILVNATIHKDRSDEEGTSANVAQLRLMQALDVRHHWGAALKCLTASRCLRTQHRLRNHQHIIASSESLEHLTQLQAKLSVLSESEMALAQHLRDARGCWLATAHSTAVYSSPTVVSASEQVHADRRLELMTMKMEVMRMLSCKFLSSCDAYNWNRDIGCLLPLLRSLRGPPITPGTFL